MLQVKNLTLYHQKDLKEIINNLSFVVNVGDKVAVIGEEGNGKTTLLKWIMDDDSIDSFISVTGEKYNQFSKPLYLPQVMPKEQLKLTLDTYFFGQDDNVEMDYQLLYQLVGKLGLDAKRLTSDQLLCDLSGGEKVKVQLLKILAKDPDLLLLDEPSNDLDMATIKWLENYIKNSSMTILFISHDESLLKATATKVIHLELLRHKTRPVSTVSSLSYEKYVAEKETKFIQELKVANKQREEHQKKMERYQRIESSVHDAQNTVSRQSPGVARLLKKKMHAVKSMERRFDREKEQYTDKPIKEDAILVKFSHTKNLPAGKTILHLENDSIILNNRPLARNLNLYIHGPQKIGIIGKNGIGKSTWMKQLWENMKNREDISVGYMPQSYFDILSEEETPISFLSETGEREERTQIMTYLGSMRYTIDEMNHPISGLSGGQQAKLFLLKMDLTGHNVLLLDEPTRNFSPLSQRELRKLFQTFTGAIITISHDRLFLQEVCDSVYELTPTGFEEVSFSEWE